MNRSIEARNRLVVKYAYLAESIVKSQFPESRPNVRRSGGEDAFLSEAYLALIQAADAWKDDSVPFEKVASRFIYLACIRLLGRGGLIKVPHNQKGENSPLLIHPLTEKDHDQIDRSRDREEMEARDELGSLLLHLPEEERQIVRDHMIGGSPPKNRHTRNKIKRVFGRLEELAAGGK